MKKILTIAAFLIGFNGLYGQNFNSSEGGGARFVGDAMSRKLTNPEDAKKVQGSMYISDEFLTIKILNQKEVKLCLAKYNAFTGNMEVKSIDDKEADTFILLKDNNDFTIEFTTNGDIYQTYSYLNEGVVKRDFFVNLVSTNRVSLLKKQKVEFIDETPAKSSYEKSKPAKFDRLKDSYYVKIGSANTIILPSNKKSIAKLFPKYESEIKTFIKENKIKTSKEKDLITLVEYINQL
jgi:hypothetical protein